MKNLILLACLILTGTTSGFSQKIKIGIVGGPVIAGNTRENVNQQTGDSLQDYSRSVSSILSYFGGVVISIPVSKTIIFRPQIEYTLKGFKNHFTYTNPNVNGYDTHIKANCIDIPLNFVYNVPTKNGRFFLGLGPYFSYVLSGKIQNFNDSIDKKIVFDSETKGPLVNRFDIGVNVIASYEFRNGFFCSLNYAYGFRDFRLELKNATNPSNKNTALGLSIGYMFK